MRIDVFTLFPALVEAHAAESLLGRAVRDGLVELRVHDLRDHGIGRHRQVDDTVFGGGPGMVLRPDVVAASVQAAGAAADARRLVMSPAGRRLDQGLLHELAGAPSLALLCGRYEGIDERVIDAYGFEAVSIGDYVVAGGEVAAAVVVEGVARLLPGVMGNIESSRTESFEDGLLEPPTYTRPARWQDRTVPEVLLSGNHAAIAIWRRSESIRRTAARRPDLLCSALAAGVVSQAEVQEAIGAEAATIGDHLDLIAGAAGRDAPAPAETPFDEEPS